MKRKSIVIFFIIFSLTLNIFGGNLAYALESDFTYEIAEDGIGIKITGYSGPGGEVTIPATIGGISVVAIGNSAFEFCDGEDGNPNITAVNIPETVETIGAFAFISCTNLTEVSFSGTSQLRTIEEQAFAMTGVTSFTVPKNVETIESFAFSYCKDLKTVSFSEDSELRIIGNNAFTRTGLTSFAVPKNVETIESSAFAYTGLTSFTVPKGVKKIGWMIFENCKHLTTIHVDSENEVYTSVDGIVFNKDETGLIIYPPAKEGTSYTVPRTVTFIKEGAFVSSSELQEVIIPNSVEKIERWAFQGCTSLKSITIPKSVQTLGFYLIMQCTGPITVTILNNNLKFESPSYFSGIDIALLTIRGYVGSTAQAHAKCYGYTFVELPMPVMEGSGSMEDPYQIVYIEQLQAIGSGDYGLNECYILEKNLDFQSDESYYDPSNKGDFTAGMGFKPIGDIEAMDFDPKTHIPFSGCFDGNGKTISNLFIDRPVFNEASIEDGGITVGLFGGTMGTMGPMGTMPVPCIIKDLELINPNITGANRVGALAGASMFTKFENCRITGGTVTGTAVPDRETEIENFVGRTTSTGGMLGMVYTKGSGIYNCSASAVVVGTDCVGGLVGYNYGNEIQCCFSTGAVSGEMYVGGLAGCNIGSAMEMSPGIYRYFYAIIENSYATGNITATGVSSDTGTGGLVGYNHVFAEINNTYALGNVSGTNNCGGLVGHNNLGAITYSYATGDVTGTGSAVGGLIGLYQMRASSGGGAAYMTVLKNSIAFNDQVFGSSSDIGKVIGKCSDMETVSNCYSNENMTISEMGSNIISGTDITQDTFRNSDFYAAADNWNGAAWDLAGIWLIGPVRPLLRITNPAATEVSISGTAQVGKTLTGSYTFNADIEGHPESESIYRWYSAIDANGIDKTEITGAVGLTYMLELSNLNAYIAFEVMPSDGTDTGGAVMSDWIGPVTAASSGHTDHPSGDNDFLSGADVYINGERHTAGNIKTITKNGKSITTVTVNSNKLDKLLESKGNGATVTIPVKDGADTSSGVLTGQMVKNMEDREATLEMQTGSASYTLPAGEIDIDAVANQFGENVDIAEINVNVTISEPSNDTVEIVENAAEEDGFALMVQAVEFDVTCTYNGETVAVGSFSAFVERTIKIPEGVNPYKITTAIVVDPDGTTRHVPTKITVINGTYYAVINSLTNSIYTLIYNPIEFADVAEHWAADAINDMASRKVINGYPDGKFVPDGSITRAEFTAIIVRALGLPDSADSSSFNDADADNWFSEAVNTAENYGLIRGYSDDIFGSNDKITREQAITIVARAMSITGLDARLTNSDVSILLDDFSDASDISAYAQESVAACLSTGVITGRGSNILAPKDNMTRAEAAMIVKRLLQQSDLI